MRHLALALVFALPCASSAQDAPPKVVLVRAEMRTLNRPVEQPGSIRADQEAVLSAKLAGYVDRVLVDLGDRVTKGQILIELSAPELDAEARQKAALVAQARLAIRLAKQGVETAKAQVDTAQASVQEAMAGVKRGESNRDRWASESRRIDELAAKAVVDRQTQEETRNQARAADAALDEVRAKVVTAEAMARRWQAELERAKLDVLADEARLAVTQADSDRVKALVEYKTIRAPFDGVVARRLIDVGNFVQPSRAEALLVIMTIDKVRALIDVPEVDAGLVKKGDKVAVRVPAMEGREFAGLVSRTSWSLDGQTRTLRAEVDLDNKDGALRPGMFVNAAIGVSLAPLRALPAKALSKAGETHAVFVVRDGKAARVRVRVGRTDGAWTEIVEIQGFDEKWAPPMGDEKFIANPPANLASGQEVEIVK